MRISTCELADFLDAEHAGDPIEIMGVNSIDRADQHELTFCVYDDPKWFERTSAEAVVSLSDLSFEPDATLIKIDDPQLGFIKIVDEFFRERPDSMEIHPSTVIGDDVEIGNRCEIGPHVHIRGDVTIGDRCIIKSGASIGGDGSGYVENENGRLVKQIYQGKVIIEDDVEIGANSVIDRGDFEETIVEQGTKIDDLVHLSHDTVVGKHTMINRGCSTSGTVTIGDHVTLNPHSAIAPHVEVGDRAEVGMNSTVLDNVEAGTTVVGSPAKVINSD
ncbi:DapH/DapD/GlmU-related protein [Natronorubrum sulfidifaciens]|nr:DapH/DapD/GlmU-related protein [Natronorubrum sulfidifaciens]